MSVRGAVVGLACGLAFGGLAAGTARPPAVAPAAPRLAEGGFAPGNVAPLAIGAVRPAHPRIWLDGEALSRIRARAAGMPRAELRRFVGETAPGLALAWLATGDASLCAEGFAKRDAGPPHHVALLYDWCHDALAPDARATLRAGMVPRMVSAMDNGRLWRSFHNAGHAAAFQLTVAALALHGEEPEAERALRFLEPELADMRATLDQVFSDGAWGEGVDYARHASHESLRTFLALESATGQDLIGGSPHFRNVAKYILYVTKPNGLVFPGDDDDFPYLSGWERMALLMVASRYRDPHAADFLARVNTERFALPERDRFSELLWADPSIPSRPFTELPLARFFPSKGLLLARTGWRIADRPTGDAWLAFTNGDYFGDHDHLDVNALQIHAGGELAIDSGRYDDDWAEAGKPDRIARSQFFNYYQRTIAHNSMLVRDPAEEFGHGLVNDGGQRHLLWRGGKRNVPEDYAQGSFPSDEGRGACDWVTNPGRWERGDVTAYVATPDLVFVRGDGTRAYADHKVSAFVRELLFVRPRLVVVFDRVVAKEASFAKTWLLHTVDEPRLAEDGSWFEVEEGQGRLFGAVVLPRDHRLGKVGGKGSEHLVAGVPYRAGPASELHPSDLHHGEIPGAWRIEETPGAARAEDHFLNVMLLGEAGGKERPAIEDVAEDAASFALTIRAGGQVLRLRFAKDARATSLRFEQSGAVRFDGPLPGRVVADAPVE